MANVVMAGSSRGTTGRSLITRSADGYEHTVNSHINRLRGKIEKDLSNPKYILTAWGVGYRFNEDL